MLFRIFFKLFRKQFRDITKISPEEEYKLYLLREPEDTLKLIKSITTIQVMRTFEARNDEERYMSRGAALILKLIKDAHLFATEIKDFKDEDKIKAWNKFKSKSRIN